MISLRSLQASWPGTYSCDASIYLDFHHLARDYLTLLCYPDTDGLAEGLGECLSF